MPAFEQNKSIGPTSRSVSSTSAAIAASSATSTVAATPPMASATATGTVAVDVGRHDGGCALGRESLGQGPADPRRGARDDDDLVPDVHVGW